MTKLEEEIGEAIENAGYLEHDIKTTSKLVAEVTKKYIEKALRDSTNDIFTGPDGIMTKVQNLYVETWLKENGIV